MTEQDEHRKGLIYALICYLIWGAFPIYWAPLNHSEMPAEQILAQRIAWSAVFAFGLLLWFKQGRVLWQALQKPRIWAIFSLSSLLIAINWLVYLWAITHHHILDASLGYFMNPLFNVFLGWLVFKERLGKAKMLAIALAVVGVLWLALPAGRIPWVSLWLAGSFGLYALIRKLAPMEALAGLTLETLLLFPFALAYLLWCGIQGNLVWANLNAVQFAVLLGSGAVTTIPLLCFGASAKRIPMSQLGILQYVSPTLQMLCGLLIFGEQFDGQRFIGYAWVWAGVFVFLWAMWHEREKRSS